MDLIKKHVKQDIAELPTFSNLEDSVEFFHTTEDESLRDYVVEEIAKFHNGPEFLIVYIHDHDADKKILTKMGGSLTPNSVDFVSKLFKNNLLDRVETRNIEIKLSNKVLKNFREIIIKIFNFELEWIKYNQKRNLKSKNKIKNDSISRIKEIKKRLKNFSNA